MNLSSHIQQYGEVEVIIENKSGYIVKEIWPNTCLDLGKESWAAALANEIGDAFEFYIDKIVVGNNGAVGGVKKNVDSRRTGLFGSVLLTKNVAASINPSLTRQVIFTSVITFDELVGYTISELGLVMKNGEYYSIVTNNGISKTAEMQLTINWRITFF